MARTKSELLFNTFANFPVEGEQDLIYIATDSNIMYIWNGGSYVTVSGNGDMTKAVYDPANGAKQVAFNDSVVHLTGNETIAGDKTFSGNTSTQSLFITGTNGAGHLHLKHQATDPTATGSSTVLFADSNGNLKYKNDGLNYVTFSTNANTADRVYTFPNKTGNVILDTSFGDVINSATEKTTPVDADMIGLMDSAASNILKKLSWANIKATLKTYFDSLTTTLTNKTLALSSNTISGTKAQFNTACTDGDFIYSGDNATSLNMNTAKILGRSTASAGAVEEISVGTGLSLSGGTLSATASGGGFWTAMPGTPTRASNTTFTVTGDVTAYVAKGMVIKWTESSTVRCAMVSIPSTYSNPNTTITIIGDTMASIDASSLKYGMIGTEMFMQQFNVAGTIGATGTDVSKAYYANEPMRVIGADLQVGTAGTTNNTTVDINKGGATMFTTKPTLATTVASSPTPFTADTATSLALGDKVTIDIDAVQTTSAVDLYVQLYLFPTRYLSLT